MKIIKLNAIDSTNSFLKELVQDSLVEDYTVVVAESQTSGRGQMNNSWHSKPFKNLTFSIFTKLQGLQTHHQPYLNFAVSNAIFEALNEMSVPDLKIKWPNDIMSGNLKICGVLIETTLSNQNIKNTIIGIGLNVNQEKFPNHLRNASSLKNILKKELDLDTIMNSLIEKIQYEISNLEALQLGTIHENYLKHLYKLETPAAFKDEESGLFFMGIIKGVSTEGNLLIQLEDDSVKEFGIKEVSLAKG